MVAAVQDLSERSLSEDFYNLVSVSKMIVWNDHVIPSLIIVSVVVSAVVRYRSVLLTACTNCVYVGILQDLLLLVLGKISSLTTSEQSFKKDGMSVASTR